MAYGFGLDESDCGWAAYSLVAYVMKDTWFGWDEHVPPKHGRTEMAELPVLKVYGAMSLTFTVRGRAESMLIDTHSGLPPLQIPDNMEVVVRRAGDSVDVVTRGRS